MTNNQDPRRMKDMMGELARGKPDSIDKIAQDENSSKPSQLDIDVFHNSNIGLFGYVGAHQELKIDYKILSIKDVGLVDELDFGFRRGGFYLKGPQVKESFPGLDSDELQIIGHKRYSVRIPDTGKGGVYSLTLTNMDLDQHPVKVRLNFSTGVWTTEE